MTCSRLSSEAGYGKKFLRSSAVAALTFWVSAMERKEQGSARATDRTAATHVAGHRNSGDGEQGKRREGEKTHGSGTLEAAQRAFVDP